MYMNSSGYPFKPSRIIKQHMLDSI